MTVTNENRSVTYNGDGSTTVFPVANDGVIYFLQPTDLLVTLIDADGTEHVQALTTNYTVAGAGEQTGGSVTMLIAPAVGNKLRIERIVNILQPTNYPENTKFPAKSHERALDRLTMIDQQQQGELNRAPKFSIESGKTDVEIRPGEAGRVLGWGPDGNIIPLINSAAEAEIIADETREYRDESLDALGKTISARDRAEIAATTAAIDAAKAEGARDSAFVNADVYSDIAAGLAGTTDGQQFQVISADGLEIIRYRNDGGAAVEIARYPSAEAVAPLQRDTLNRFAVKDIFGHEIISYSDEEGFGIPTSFLRENSDGSMRLVDADGFIAFEVSPEKGFGVPGAWFRRSQNALWRIMDEDGFVFAEMGTDGVFEYTGKPEPTQPATAVRIVSGALTDTGFDVVADVEGDGPGLSQLVVATDPLFNNRVYLSQVAMPQVVGVNRTLKFQAAGLAPDTRYYYAIATDGRFDAASYRTLRTLPAKGTAAPFRLVFGSCSDIRNPQLPALSAIAQEDALFLLHLGDITYSDIAENSIARARAENARAYRSKAEADALNASLPLVYMPSDHDFADNDPHWDKHYAGTTFEQIGRNTRQAYRETVPHYPFVQAQLGETNPDKILLTQVFDVAKSRFIVIDAYSQTRFEVGTPTAIGNATNPPSAWDQLSWLLSAITDAANAGLDNLFLATPRGWTPAINAGWEEIAPAERQQIVDHVLATPGLPRVTILGADAHFCGADDGTNAGLPFIMASPFRMHVLGNTNGERTEFSWNGSPSDLVGTDHAYAVLDVAADGNWTVTFKSAPNGVPTVLATFSSTEL